MSDKKNMKCYLFTAYTNNMHVLKLAPMLCGYFFFE